MEPITVDIRALIKDDLARLRRYCGLASWPRNGATLEEKVPPEPRRTGGVVELGPGNGPRKKQGERKRLDIHVDAVLHHLFETERTKLGISGQNLLTRILFNRYDCPLLSFEQNKKKDTKNE